MIKKKAFTLIELLVVIAVIGILASLLLVALRTARDKAQDARIKNDLGNIRNQAEMVYVESHASSYVGLTSDNDYQVLIADIGRQGGTLIITNIAEKTFAISTKLNTNGNWCVDSQGLSIAGTATATGCVP
jgi:prepilin-type N-terminal cleavage/methylation domain-containing protein